MSACIGAEAAGARAMTATSANGVSLMWERLYIASSLRLPIVLSLVNRAVSGPLNIHCDHSDAMGVRDAGWIMLFSETNQEAYDNTLMAHRIAEHKDVMLPLMVCQDGFITSHSIENIELIEDSKVKEFVGEYHPKHYLLNSKESESKFTEEKLNCKNKEEYDSIKGFNYSCSSTNDSIDTIKKYDLNTFNNTTNQLENGINPSFILDQNITEITTSLISEGYTCK